MPRLYREAPLNSIWEGSGNVIALDVLRALARSPESLEAFFARGRRGGWRRAAARRFVDRAARATSRTSMSAESRARRLVERMALALQGSLLVRHGDPAVADAFCASRLDGEPGPRVRHAARGVDAEAIIARHAPTG